MNIEFRQLQADEVDAAHEIHCASHDWLKSKGINHCVAPLSHEQYKTRQDRGQNFGLFVDGRLAVIASIVTLGETVWKNHIGTEKSTWMGSLATAERFHGRGLGREMVRQAADYVAQKGAKILYIDCLYGTGFLPEYYKSLGFEQIVREIKTYPMGTYDVVLMKKPLSD